MHPSTNLGAGANEAREQRGLGEKKKQQGTTKSTKNTKNDKAPSLPASGGV